MSGPPKKVLFAIDAMARGGTELQVAGLIARLDRARFAPILLTLRPTPTELAPDDCEILAWQVPRLLSPDGVRQCRALRSWLKDNRVVAVHTFFQDATVFAGAAARLANVPVRVAGFRDLGFWRTRAQETLVRLVYPHMTGFVANSSAVKEHFCHRDGLDPDRVQVIPNGIEIANLPWTEHNGPSRHVVIVGNLNRQVKRIDLFVRAAGLLHTEFPDVRWHVCGDGGLRPELEKLAATVGLGDAIIFHGRVPDVAERLAGMQVGVNCSDSEGFSNAVLEYMLKGCVVVATDVGGNAEAVQSGVTGLLVPKADAAGLASGLRSVLKDADLRSRLAVNARQWAAENFSWERCVAAHETIYSDGAPKSAEEDNS